MKYALDGMQEMMDPGASATFDEDFYSELVACFDKFDPELMLAQDTEWDGMMQFAASGGGRGDHWPSCETLDELGLVSILCGSSGTLRN